MEEALFLTKFATKVYVIHRRDQLRAEKILQDRLFNEEKKGKVQIHWNSELNEVLGDNMGVNGVVISTLDEKVNIPVHGVFIAIGHKPNTDIFRDSLEMDETGYLKIQSGIKGNATQCSKKGVFAAGDVSDSIYRQAITSAGAGCMAALDAEKFLDN